MKKILIYGDSNVWGDNFITGMRIPDNKQWVNILRNKLKKKYTILQEGLPGRLAGDNETIKTYKNGKSNFISTFRTTAPIDMIIIALGTNDLQTKYDKTAKDIINDLVWYKETIEKSYNDPEDRKKYFINNKLPTIIYILPINFDYKKNANTIFNENSEKKRQEIIKFFEENNFNFVVSSDMPLFDDGIHLNFEGHKKQADIIERVVNEYE